jgi:ElaB/YqjD/DUF883 family membrane-anchored ribosome-binding protein
MGETTDAIRGQIDDQRHQLEDNLEGIEGKLKGASDQAHEKVQETKDQVQEKIEEVQQKVQDAADWRQQFDKRPMVGLGVAFGGGFLLAGLLGGGSKKKDDKSQSASYSYPPQHQNPQYQSYYGNGGPSGGDVGRQHVSSTFDNMKGALMGVAAAQAKSFFEKSVPGFDKEYSQVENETGSEDKKQQSNSMGQAATYPAQTSSQQADQKSDRLN